jgi:hypothetical protein
MESLKPGTLMAWTGEYAHVIRRIVRVVQDYGDTVLIESDSHIEGEAAVEYDFPTPEPLSITVPKSRLRPIVEE